MLLPHLLPFLDAEIDRLQRARDLLAYVPPADTAAFHSAEPRIAPAPPPATPAAVKVATATETAVEPRIIVLKPHGKSRERVARRRQSAGADTALRGPVPTGPVVVSAEEVRRAQAIKVAQASKPAADEVRAFEWRNQLSANDASGNNVSALLKKLLDIGSNEESTPQVALSLVTPLMHR